MMQFFMKFTKFSFIVPFQSKYRDIHVICGTLKDFLRNLTEPLVTFALHEAFSDAASE